jgi:hypothetical protein
MNEGIPKPRRVYEGGVDNGLRPTDSLIDFGGDTETPVRSANDRRFEWTHDGRVVAKKPELKLVPQTEELVKDISTTPVSMAEYEQAVALFDAAQKESEKNVQGKTIPSLNVYEKQGVVNHPSSSRNIDGQALIAKINAIENLVDREYENGIADVENREQASVKTQDRIFELEKQYRDADSEERRRAIARELRVENQTLKKQLESKIQEQEMRLREISDRKKYASPAEVMKIHARLKVYENLVEDINHPGRREFQTAIVKLENELAKYPESYLASNPADPDILIKKAQLKAQQKGQLQAYRALLAESMQEDERGIRSEAVSASQAVPEKGVNKIDSTKQTSKESIIQAYRALLAERMWEDERGVRSEAVSASQAVPEKGINKIDPTKQTPEERSKRKESVLERLAGFGWERKVKKDDRLETENSKTTKTQEERLQEFKKRLIVSTGTSKREIERQVSVARIVPTSPVKENVVKTFAKKAWGKVTGWFS